LLLFVNAFIGKRSIGGGRLLAVYRARGERSSSDTHDDFQN